MEDNKTLWQGHHWQINWNFGFTLPAYLFVNSLHPQNTRFSDLPHAAYAELGPAINLATSTLETAFSPHNILCGKFGLVPGFAIHFHVVPIYDWVLDEFGKQDGYDCLQTLNPPGYPVAPDGSELLAFIWRHYCSARNKPPETAMTDVEPLLTRTLANLTKGLT